MNNALLDLIKTRRSCRHYKAEQISDEELNAVLEAGTYAPTYLLVFASEDNANAFQDGSCVLENMMLAAHALGLATCWINREYQMFQTEEGKNIMKEIGLKEGLIGIGALSLGYPSREPKPAAERKADWTVIVK